MENAGNQRFPFFVRLLGCVFLREEALCHGSHTAPPIPALGGFLGAKNHQHLKNHQHQNSAGARLLLEVYLEVTGQMRHPEGIQHRNLLEPNQIPKIPEAREERIPICAAGHWLTWAWLRESQFSSGSGAIKKALRGKVGIWGSAVGPTLGTLSFFCSGFCREAPGQRHRLGPAVCSRTQGLCSAPPENSKQLLPPMAERVQLLSCHCPQRGNVARRKDLVAPVQKR